jgi:molybdenum-dependent DNA-binding transcriptional regulator ModE
MTCSCWWLFAREGEWMPAHGTESGRRGSYTSNNRNHGGGEVLADGIGDIELLRAIVETGGISAGALALGPRHHRRTIARYLAAMEAADRQEDVATAPKAIRLIKKIDQWKEQMQKLRYLQVAVKIHFRSANLADRSECTLTAASSRAKRSTMARRIPQAPPVRRGLATTRSAE